MNKKDIIVLKHWQNFSKWANDSIPDPEDSNYEKVRAEIIENNQIVLKDFKFYLKEKLGLSDRMVKRHLFNIDFFINDGAIYYDLQTPDQAYRSIDYFLSMFFPRKAMWATPSNIKENGSSLKRFYTFLYELEEIDESALKYAKGQIKEGLEEGLEYLEEEKKRWEKEDESWDWTF